MAAHDSSAIPPAKLPPDTWWWRGLMWFFEHVITFFLRLWVRTWRVEYLGLDSMREARKRGGVYFGVWHQNIFALSYTHAYKSVVALVSPVWEGELIARLVKGIGYELVRGSRITNRLSGFTTAVRVLREGRILTMAMDGPEGPAYVVKPGTVTMAASGRAMIIPATCDADWAFHLPTWDGHLLPCPFARVVVSYGPALALPKRPRGPEIEEWCRRIEQSMHFADERVAKALRSTPR